jgi:adenylate cyclase
MWFLVTRSPTGEPREYPVRPGKNIIGRSRETGVFVPDRSASRAHAELEYDPAADTILLRDLGSTNGTYVNRERITEPRRLRPGDVIRIGEHTITLARRDTNPITSGKPLLGTQPFTRDYLLESLDQHAILMYEAARQLNTVTDVETALHEVSSLMRVSMGAAKCEVILADQFDKLAERGFPTSIAKPVIEGRAAVLMPNVPDESPRVGQSALLLRVRSALCVPIISGDELLGLIYMYKTSPEARPFDESDMRLATAISHQAALTIQRAQLLEKVRLEEKTRQFLQRFLSPPEAEFILQDYQRTGHLPGLSEQRLTLLFADIRSSTGLAERAGVVRFGEMLSRYYQDITQLIFKHGGMLDKYIGDGVMAVFGLTRSQADPEERAVRTGLAILDWVDDFNRAEPDPIELGVAINTGTVMAGYVGTEQRVEFTVLGDPVNVAYRLEALARPNRVLIGPATAGAIAGKFNLNRLGPVDLKGRTKPIQVHEVLRG